MRTGTICQYLRWMEMGALFSILGAVLFSTTSDDISPISHVFAHLWQITPSDAASTCPSDKRGGGRRLADRWVTTAELGEKNPTGGSGANGKEVQREKSGAPLNMKSQGWGSITQSEANSCQSVSAISLRGQQKVDKIQVEMKLVARVGRYKTSKETRTKRPIPFLWLILVWSWTMFLSSS